MLTKQTLSASLLAAAGLVAAALPAEDTKRSLNAPAVAIDVQKDFIEFRHGKDLTARYHIAPTVAKPYFWPLNGPSGTTITRPWPMVKDAPGEKTDHVHQKSTWFCHGDVIPEGIELKSKVKGVEGVDFWSETTGHGRIVCHESRHAGAEGYARQGHDVERMADRRRYEDPRRDARHPLLQFRHGTAVHPRHRPECERLPDHVRRHEGRFAGGARARGADGAGRQGHV